MSATALWSAIERRLASEGDRLAFDAEKTDGISYSRLRGLTAAVAEGFEGTGPVAILANRSFEAYVAVLACFRFGRVFVPLNPSFPAGRLQKIVAASGATECLYDERHAALAADLDVAKRRIDLGLPSVEREPIEAVADTRAYHLFTSGSTGEPKGVPITHGSLSHYVTQIARLVGIPEHSRSTQFFDLSFDPSLHDIFVGLSTGGTVIPANDMAMLMPHRYVAANRIDIWFSVPLLAVLAARGQRSMPADTKLRMAMFAGEGLPGEYAAGIRQLMPEGGEVWNLYGPTEGTIIVTGRKLTEEDFEKPVVSIGRSFGENRLAVLADGAILPAEGGSEGELLLGGPQIFEGYEPPVASDCFVYDAGGERFYRSGDLVRCENGTVEYLGRIDSQVKIRGLRVELGEIEAVCVKQDGVDAAAALVLGEGANAHIVVAYQGDPDADFSALGDSLPAYMVPKRTRHFDALPVNSSGKVDRKALKQLL